MAELGDDFDDLQDDEPFGPLLPREDRLWRHPSEISSDLSAALGGPPPEQVMAARRRWLANTPTRAGAGAAGLVGAILAAGVVLIGVHLTSWLPARHTTSAGDHAKLYGDTTPTTSPSVKPIGMAGFFDSLNSAIVKVRSVVHSRQLMSNGVVVSANGYVLVAASAVDGAVGVSVMLSDGEEQPAQVVGTDSATGLAVLHIAHDNLPWLAFSTARQVPGDSFLVTAWKSPRLEMQLVTLEKAPAVTDLAGGPALLQLCPRSLRLGHGPLGSALVDSTGQVIGFVTAHRNGRAVAAPGWLAVRVAGELIANGHVAHGWLGIVAKTALLPGHVLSSIEKASPGIVGSGHPLSREGVRVLSVEPGSAAATAGLRPGDVIEAVDGQAVHSVSALQAALYLMAPTSSVDLEIVRGHRLSDMSVRLQAAA